MDKDASPLCTQMDHGISGRNKLTYTQCKLKKGNFNRVTWIPTKFAKVGKVLRLKDDDGWVVQEIWKIEDESAVKAREREHDQWAIGRGLKK